MGIYFGTDGIRGVVNKDLTYNLAFTCGNSLTSLVKNPKVIIGRDSRVSGEMLTMALAGGVLLGGGSVIDIGVCTTPGIAYITKYLKGDFGIVISASHNPPEYNGIKIFDSNGVKLSDKNEEQLERLFIKNNFVDWKNIGTYKQKFSLVDKYVDYLTANCDYSLKNLKIVVDGSNGAGGKIFPKVLRKLGAKVIAINCKFDGININNKCGAVCPEKLSISVKKYGGDLGLSLDGDGDRLIAVDENGDVIDGDNIIYILAKQFKKDNKLVGNMVVGTKHTNKAIEISLKKLGIDFGRTDIGDKYVCEKMDELGASLGGEKSGHIIIRDYLMTGDGILAGIKLAEIMKKNNKKISEINDVELFPQTNIDCVVADKLNIINNKKLLELISKEEKCLGKDYRIMVRASGTENKIRIMVEGKDECKTKNSANNIRELIEELNGKQVGE